MADIHLVTGYAGSAHITAADQGAFNAALLGTGNYVLNIGNKFSVLSTATNQITISDGDLVMEGRHVRSTASVSLTIENGVSGQNRNDLIVCRYTKDANDNNKEKCELVVIKGTATSGTASDPTYNNDSILDGDSLVDFPLYRVPITGTSVGSPVQLFNVVSVLTSGGNGLTLVAGVDYGTTLPSAGNVGKVFFKKV